MHSLSEFIKMIHVSPVSFTDLFDDDDYLLLVYIPATHG